MSIGRISGGFNAFNAGTAARAGQQAGLGSATPNAANEQFTWTTQNVINIANTIENAVLDPLYDPNHTLPNITVVVGNVIQHIIDNWPPPPQPPVLPQVNNNPQWPNPTQPPNRPQPPVTPPYNEPYGPNGNDPGLAHPTSGGGVGRGIYSPFVW